MRHKKHSTKLGRTTAHRKAMLSNLAKSFIMHEKVSTTVDKAKELKKFVEPIITLARKGDTVVNRRRATQLLSIRYNRLTPKEARKARSGDLSAYNDDRKVVKKLFEELGPKHKDRPGGYTRIVRTSARVGDAAPLCIIESV